MNPSQTVAAPRIDPEDRIFDSPSSSVSSVESDTEDYEDDIIPARQQLLSTLQESLDDIRANVLELTQQTPEPRNDSQVSAVTDQISSISGRITQIRQQSLARLQHQHNASINRTMSSPRQNPTSPNPAVEENEDASLATLRSAHNYSIGDEALRRQIMALNREESVARATILAPEESSDSDDKRNRNKHVANAFLTYLAPSKRDKVRRSLAQSLHFLHARYQLNQNPKIM
ncbi:MAG: hypothetical protein Q9197_003717 [Variospora fuerteventurae]